VHDVIGAGGLHCHHPLAQAIAQALVY
jgi:hypothetical protein